MSNQDKKETIRRSAHDKENPYVMISKLMLHDKSISPKAKGVLCYLLSLPSDWQIHLKQVAEAMGVGKDQIYSAFDEMIEFGYAIKTEIPGEKGQFSSVHYEICEFKNLNTVAGNPPGPPGGKSVTGNPPILKNDIQKNETTNQKDPEVVVFSDLKISEGLKNSILRSHSIIDIEIAVKRTKAWKDRESDEAAILTCLKRKDSWKDESENSEKDNILFAKSLLPFSTEFFKMELCHNYVEIAFTGGQKEPFILKYTENGFKNKLTQQINDLKEKYEILKNNRNERK